MDRNRDHKDALEIIREEFRAGSELADTFPKDDVVLTSVKEADSAIKADVEYLHALEAKISEFDENMGDILNHDRLRKEMIDKFLGSGIPLDKAADVTETMNSEVSAEAVQVYEQRVAHMQRIILMTHIFFVLGWGLSLLDKLYFDGSVSASE